MRQNTASRICWSIIPVVGIIALAAAAPTSDVSSILEAFNADKSHINIVVSFRGSNINLQKIRDAVASTSYTDRTHRINTLYQKLKHHADTIQGNVLRRMRTSIASGTEVHQLWISNQLAIKRADQKLVKHLLQMEEVSGIIEDKFVKLNAPVSDELVGSIGTEAEGTPWGVGAIGAIEIWNSGTNGSGVLVANIDTGVLSTHEALVDNFRSLNGWFDPVLGRQTPFDDHSHGTHVMGTVVGRANGIGVAPGAQWIACKGCDKDGECARIDLILCGQWVVCPGDANGSNPRCDLAPHLVSNSWVEDAGSNWYDDVVATWVVAGIFPVFGIGNDGPDCGTVRSPADSWLAFGAGAHNSSNGSPFFRQLSKRQLTFRQRSFRQQAVCQ